MTGGFISRLMKDSAFTAAGSISGMLFHLVSIMLAARYASKETLGLYLLLLAVVHFMSIFGGLGLDFTLVRHMSGRGERADLSAFLPVVCLRAITLPLLILIACAISMAWSGFPGGVRDQLAVISGICVLASFRDLFYCFMQGLRRFKVYSGVQIGSAVLRCVLISFTAMTSGSLDLTALVEIEVAATALSVLILAACVPWREVFGSTLSSGGLRELLRFSGPLYANSILTILNDRISVFMIAGLLEPASVACYEIAGKIPDGCFRMFNSFITVYFPSLSVLLSKGDRDGARKLINSSVIIFGTLIMGLVMLVFMFRNELMVALFSAKYAQSAMACALLMLCFNMRAVSNIMGYSLVSAGHSSIPMKVNVITCTAHFIGLVYFLPRFGFVGAVYSLLIMNFISVLMYYLYLYREGLAVDMTRGTLPLLAAGAMIGIQAWLGTSLPATRVLFPLIYAVLCWLLIPELSRIVRRIAGAGLVLYPAFNHGQVIAMPEDNLNVLMCDSTVGNDYSINLCSALEKAGVNIVLATTRDRQIETTVTFPLRYWAPSKEPSVSSLRKCFHYLLYLWRVFLYLKSKEKPIVHFQFFRLERIESLYLLFLRLTGIKAVYTAHNVLPHECLRIDFLLKKIVYASARNIVAHSEHLKKSLIDRFKVPPGKIAVISHGNYDTFLPAEPIAQSEARNQLAIPADANVILFFGYIRKYKGVELLLEAFHAAAAHDSQLRLILAGHPMTPDMHQWCSTGLSGADTDRRILKDLTFIPRNRAILYFTACDAVVLPYTNIYHSGVIHMAYSFGKPVIATRVGDFAEVVLESQTGYLLKENSASCLARTLQLAFADKKTLEQMGAAAKKLSSTLYSWDTIAGRTRQLYQTVSEERLQR